MQFFPNALAVLCLAPTFLLAEVREVPQVPTRAEADAAIAAEMRAREVREAERKATIESVPAMAEWEVDHGNRRTLLRRVAPPISQSQNESPLPNSRLQPSPPKDNRWTEDETAALLAEQPVSRMLGFNATVFDKAFTEISWRDEDQQEWTILSNIDFRYLGGLGIFTDENHHWITLLFVDEVDPEKEAAFALNAAEKGFTYTPRTSDQWLNFLPSDFLRTPSLPNSTNSPLDHFTNPQPPEYFIVTDREATEIPAALTEELDALHRYYHAHEQRLIAEFETNKVMNEARRAYLEANPPEPKDTVINFWKVR